MRCPQTITSKLLVVTSLLLASACSTSTTVTLKTGEELSGKMEWESERSIAVRVRRRSAPSELVRKHASIVSRKSRSRVTLVLPKRAILQVEEENYHTLALGIVGTVASVAGLAGLHTAVDNASNCDGFMCGTSEALLGVDIGVIMVGAIVAAFCWTSYSDAKRTRRAADLVRTGNGLAMGF